MQNHSGIRKCADAVLMKNEYVGGRVSQLTGECYGLPHAWGMNQTYESGYAYFKKEFVQDNFEPARKVVKSEPVLWAIPGVLHTGAQLDLVITDASKIVEIVLTETHEGFTNRSNTLTMRRRGQVIHVTENVIYTDGIFRPQPLGKYFLTPETSKEMYKISFQSQSDAVKILFDDKDVTVETTETFKPLRFIEKRQIYVSRSDTEGDPVSVHRYQFRAN
ncbi:uncharacterized protein LOC123559174 [Mercenaria mercenaria]|uniref:uncharacterized protein LOC123559174 n=1 Tax=Mercenaria mercenaria TaxID=6596 RepID=UPI00234FA045|nr:uncharacterized protein LOC123559174 [Mercenaria mercenaria]